MTEPCAGRCEDIQARMCALFDPSTTAEEAREIIAAVAECPECADRLRSEEEIRALLRRCCTQQASAPARLRQRISMQIRVTRIQEF